MCNRYIIGFNYFVFLITALLILSACDQDAAVNPVSDKMKDLSNMVSSYKSAQQDALANVEVIREFHAIYPQAFSYFSHYTSDSVWNSEILLYGRYELTLQVPVRLSENKRNIVGVGEPLFELVEYTHIERLEGGGLSLISGDGWQFGLSEWKQLKQAEGRIEKVFTKRTASQAGHTLPDDQHPFAGIRTDSPVPFFDDYIRYKKQQHQEQEADHHN